MNQKHKTLVLTDGSFDHASSRIRAILYFKLFKEFLNWNILWIPRVPVKKGNAFYKYIIFPILKRWYALKRISLIFFNTYKFVYIQRFFLNKTLISILKKRKSIIIFDFDDAIYLDKPGMNSNLNKINVVLNAANHIIVSSKELGEFCINQGFRNISIITTPIDPEKFTVHDVKRNGPIVLGWIGSSYTSEYLKVIEDALFELKQRFSIKILLIGAKSNFQLKALDVEIVPWEYDTESFYIDKMDIGIMPLPMEDYARGKGGYKLFQYMAAGIPVIASPVGINSEIVRHGVNGFLAQNNDEWISFASILIENPDLRSQFGEEGRQDALQKYSRTYCFEKIKEVIKNL